MVQCISIFIQRIVFLYKVNFTEIFKRNFTTGNWSINRIAANEATRDPFLTNMDYL